MIIVYFPNDKKNYPEEGIYITLDIGLGKSEDEETKEVSYAISYRKFMCKYINNTWYDFYGEVINDEYVIGYYVPEEQPWINIKGEKVPYKYRKEGTT